MAERMILYSVDVAIEYGLNEAIIIQLFQFWILKNKANNNNFFNGRYWTYNSINAWQEILPHFTQMQIRRAIDNLVQKGVLIKGNFNKNKFDRTCWYAFANEDEWLASKNTTTRADNKNFSIGYTDQMPFVTDNKSIRDGEQTNTSSNTNNDTSNKQSIYTPRGEKKSWGEFANVKLTDDEYEKLVKIYGLDDKVDFAIKVLDCYLENNPDAKSRYKSHYAAMQVGTWIYDKTEKDWFPTKPRIFDPEKDFVPAKPLITLE